VQASRVCALVPGTVVPETLARYYAPGVNWAGRVLYGVPLLGIVLLAMSRGVYTFHAAWVQGGLVLWLAIAVAAEGFIWPVERRLQRVVTALPGGAVTEDFRASTTADCRVVTGLSHAAVAVLILTTVLMVAQP
jgi:hypothetical protein